MIIIGIDDTDIIGSPGTNQLARRIMQDLSEEYRCVRIVRHQLLDDPRVPYTSKNGSASIVIERRENSERSFEMSVAETVSLLNCCRHAMQDWFVEGSDPGLCFLSGECPPEIVDWGYRCLRTRRRRRIVSPITRWDRGWSDRRIGGHRPGLEGKRWSHRAAWRMAGRSVRIANCEYSKRAWRSCSGQSLQPESHR